MRIVFFTDVYRPTVNGVVVSIDLFVDELRRQGHTVDIVCPRYSAEQSAEDGVVRIQSVPFLMYKEYRMASLFSHTLSSHMRKNVYDLVHIHSPFAIGLLGIYYAKRFNLPVIYTAHTNYADYLHYVPGINKLLTSERADKLAARFSNRIDLTIAPSKKIKDNLLEDGVTQPVEVMETGIELADFSGGDGRAFRQICGLNNEPLLLYLGRTTKEKNLPYLLEAFALVNQAKPDTRLAIIGQGPYLEALKKQVANLGISQAVVFAGYLHGQAKVDAYAAADLFCMTSRSETQGMTLLEAAASGLALAVVKDRAYDYIAEDGYNAVITDGDEQAYADMVVKLLDDKVRLKRLSTNSLAASQQYSIEAQTSKLLSYYESAIHAKRVKIV